MDGRLSPGDGLIVCTSDRSNRASLSTVAFSFPLKVISSARQFIQHLQVAWLISYGGGLVGGDRVRMKIRAEKGATLVLLTQGSTKVFKTRQGRYLSNDTTSATGNPTVQLYRISVSPKSFVILLPAPVTCFSRSIYHQKQVVHLEDDSASLILLDWFTSGRMRFNGRGGGGEPANGNGPGTEGEGEEWEFDRYHSQNELWIKGNRIVKDVLLLEDEEPSTLSPESIRGGRETTYRHRVDPYSCYAALFLFGPQTERLRSSISKTFGSLTQYTQSRPYSLLWSYSQLEGGGGVARCAGHSTEAVKEWVCELLEAGKGEGGIEELIGKDLWKTALA
ncbi:urease accessory protein UreD [Sporobolomyces salmoneus]|uniref:urease accessory protein UreD n=1 Tax=Sporobolomyces salmoneus TaxID=183962 RepID=UPI00317387FD